MRSFCDTRTVVALTICSRRHTQSANFIRRAETLSKGAPESEHYDDRSLTYSQLIQHRHFIQATVSDICYFDFVPCDVLKSLLAAMQAHKPSPSLSFDTRDGVNWAWLQFNTFSVWHVNRWLLVADWRIGCAGFGR